MCDLHEAIVHDVGEVVCGKAITLHQDWVSLNLGYIVGDGTKDHVLPRLIQVTQLKRFFRISKRNRTKCFIRNKTAYRVTARGRIAHGVRHFHQMSLCSSRSIHQVSLLGGTPLVPDPCNRCHYVVPDSSARCHYCGRYSPW